MTYTQSATRQDGISLAEQRRVIEEYLGGRVDISAIDIPEVYSAVRLGLVFNACDYGQGTLRGRSLHISGKRDPEHGTMARIDHGRVTNCNGREMAEDTRLLKELVAAGAVICGIPREAYERAVQA